ncbi:MAG: 16S rRNA (uracil(1498)-N(3))-methyltransferase [Actinobacteria bacterium]|nr:16S rRNA (uracil(1498)-N(3))-methyltransferase [Actinomycetota bacterium]
MGSTAPLDRDTSDHLRRVLRLSDGAALVVSDGRGRHAAAELVGNAAVVRGAPVDLPAEPTAIHVLQAVPKGRRFDEVVRVLTEVGVERVTAVAADRSVTRLEPVKAERALARWRSVARAAARQSRRPWLPTIEGPVAVDDLADVADLAGVVAHVDAAVALTEALLGWTGTELCVAIGPEGGWSDREIALWRAAGLQSVHFGRTVVRTEHAATVAAAVCAAHLGRL